MSCHGTRRIPLLEVNIQHVIDMDDFGGPQNPLRSSIDVFVRIYRREFTLRLTKPGKRFHVNRSAGSGNIPRLVGFEVGTDRFDAHQYSGDFTERMADDPYYGQKPR